MRDAFKIFVIAVIFNSCNGKEKNEDFSTINDWKAKQAIIESFADYYQGKTYLPVYSHIYNVHERGTFNLTITVSIRNISLSDTIYILKADYYNTEGENIRQYIKSPIYLSPLETIEIIIEERDIAGGSGANFVFDWAAINDKNPPLFEAVMISTYGQQGLSFTTRGVPIF